MATISISKKELKAVVKESVGEVLNQKLMEIRALLLPFVSLKEQRDVERRYKKPRRQTVKSINVKI